MAKTKTRPYVTSEYLESEEDMVAYLEAVLEEGDTLLIVQALGNIAKARGMTQIAKESGLRRESLYKAFSPEGNPEFATVLKVIRALGMRIQVASAK
jgi:probable addiction module antidote protein